MNYSTYVFGANAVQKMDEPAQLTKQDLQNAVQQLQAANARPFSVDISSPLSGRDNPAALAKEPYCLAAGASHKLMKSAGVKKCFKCELDLYEAWVSYNFKYTAVVHPDVVLRLRRVVAGEDV